MNPTLGRIVLYTVNPEMARDLFDNSGAKEVPAIVVGVFGGGDTGHPVVVNLQLFPNSNAKSSFREGVAEGTEPGTWRWPPRA